MLNMTKGELKQSFNDSDISTIEGLIASTILVAIEKGCVKRFDFLVKYAIGPAVAIELDEAIEPELPKTIYAERNPYSVEIWNHEKGQFEIFCGQSIASVTTEFSC